ncbi:transcription antitermination factor NusB [Brytella acorum]|uniref:Transcription antitermination protein NusB n=1 Tax=Brytella acorum TaxID=2959299 RepID=A0AA35Y0L4_9PROT|nr:transcription antitermination factor NusB [Brytella acorum]MDF3624401.1 transcription antitermination factor NusB [Brytella acorum]CAI9119749.1 transcription antitermination factor NusB [Brytella acorum]
MTETLESAPKRSRTLARVAAVQALFQCEQNGDNPEAVVQQFVRHRLETRADATFEEGQVPDADRRLFEEIVKGATQGQDRIDQALVEILPANWPMERLDSVLRALLRAGAFELEGDVPAGVIINEYLDVAHGFFSGDEPRMVNGVLDTLAQRKASTSPA